MAQPDFNQENVDLKVDEIKRMPQSERRGVTDQIRENLTEWLKSQFSFSDNYIWALDNMPTSLKDEYGYSIAHALQMEDWSLKVIIPPGEPQPAARKWCPSKQEVKGEWNSQSGGYTVSKTVTWDLS
jgi:hypothetical protein